MPATLQLVAAIPAGSEDHWRSLVVELGPTTSPGGEAEVAAAVEEFEAALSSGAAEALEAGITAEEWADLELGEKAQARANLARSRPISPDMPRSRPISNHAMPSHPISPNLARYDMASPALKRSRAISPDLARSPPAQHALLWRFGHRFAPGGPAEAEDSTVERCRWEAAGPDERRELAALWQHSATLDEAAEARWRQLSHVQQLALLQVPISPDLA